MIQIILLLLNIAGWAIDYVERRKIITKTEDDLIRRGTESINARLARAAAARHAAEFGHDTGVVPDKPDPNERG